MNVWAARIAQFGYQLNRPDLSGEMMAAYFREELVKMRAAIENHFGVKITAEQLWKAIKLCNETRQLQQKLYDLRKALIRPFQGLKSLRSWWPEPPCRKSNITGILRHCLMSSPAQSRTITAIQQG
jgi:hypothetical protein